MGGLRGLTPSPGVTMSLYGRLRVPEGPQYCGCVCLAWPGAALASPGPWGAGGEAEDVPAAFRPRGAQGGPATCAGSCIVLAASFPFLPPPSHGRVRPPLGSGPQGGSPRPKGGGAEAEQEPRRGAGDAFAPRGGQAERPNGAAAFWGVSGGCPQPRCRSPGGMGRAHGVVQLRARCQPPVITVALQRGQGKGGGRRGEAARRFLGRGRLGAAGPGLAPGPGRCCRLPNSPAWLGGRCLFWWRPRPRAGGGAGCGREALRHRGGGGGGEGGAPTAVLKDPGGTAGGPPKPGAGSL